MDNARLKELLENIKSGTVDIDSAIKKLKDLPYEDIGYAKIDNHRALRRGFPEVIFCQGKSVPQVKGIMTKMAENYDLILGMRATQEMFDAVKGVKEKLDFKPESGTIIAGEIPEPVYKSKILVISAGTADIPVAEEAAITAEAMGNNVERIFDAGIAGIHRILDQRERLNEASALITVAGMEGALPGIVGGLVDKPVIAVPTSVGYGSSFNGLSALLTMLNSCVPGISVVNIDNGFGAGYTASLINRLNGKID